MESEQVACGGERLWGLEEDDHRYHQSYWPSLITESIQRSLIVSHVPFIFQDKKLCRVITQLCVSLPVLSFVIIVVARVINKMRSKLTDTLCNEMKYM